MCRHLWFHSVTLEDGGSNGTVYVTLFRWFRRCLMCRRTQYLLHDQEYQEPCYDGR